MGGAGRPEEQGESEGPGRQGKARETGSDRHRAGPGAEGRQAVPGGTADHRHRQQQPAQRRRQARLLQPGRLLVAGSQEPQGAVHPARRPEQPGQLRRSPQGHAPPVGAGAGADRRLGDHQGPAVLRARHPSPARLVRRQGNAHEPKPAVLAGDHRQGDRAQHRGDRYAAPGGGGACRGRAGGHRRAGRTGSGRRAQVVPRLPDLDEHPSLTAPRSATPRTTTAPAG